MKRNVFCLFAFVITAAFITGCTYMVNPKNEVLRKADALEKNGKYSEADQLRKDAATMPDSTKKTYIPILQSKPVDSSIKSATNESPNLKTDQNIKDYNTTYPGYTSPAEVK